jgi:GNAT superfamily N-acetyltransferase
MRVERAGEADAAAVRALFDEAAAWLGARGILQWSPGTWPEAAIAAAIARGEVWVVRGARTLSATLSLVDADRALWGRPSGDELYLHKLIVARAHRNERLGKQLLGWACGEACARGRTRLRLDCVAGNAFLRRYYAGAGFAERGEVDLGSVRLARFELTIGKS